MLGSQAVPLADRVRMTCSVTAVLGGLLAGSDLYGDVPQEERARHPRPRRNRGSLSLADLVDNDTRRSGRGTRLGARPDFTIEQSQRAEKPVTVLRNSRTSSTLAELDDGGGLEAFLGCISLGPPSRRCSDMTKGPDKAPCPAPFRSRRPVTQRRPRYGKVLRGTPLASSLPVDRGDTRRRRARTVFGADERGAGREGPPIDPSPDFVAGWRSASGAPRRYAADR